MTGRMPFALLGAGGHAAIIADLLALLGEPVEGFVGPEDGLEGLPSLGDDDALLGRPRADLRLANGIGTLNLGRRAGVYARFAAAGFEFPPLVHPRACVSPRAILAPACHVMAGAVVQARAQIGENAIINTAASIDHDCRVGAHAHVAPGAILTGGVEVGERVHVGAGATVVPGIRIGADAIVGAGAVVTRDVEAGARVLGVPAREVPHATS